MPALFAPGRLVATPAALALLERLGHSPLDLLARHVAGDWGEVCDDDRQTNADALESGAMLLSVYPLSPGGDAVWVITDAVDHRGRRFCTTVLLPEEY